MRERKLPGGGDAHELTTADRRKGAERTNEIKRARRAEAAREAKAKLEDAVDQAVETLVAELRADASTDRIRAAAQILDRSWGKPRQAHDVRVEFRLRFGGRAAVHGDRGGAEGEDGLEA